MPAGIKSISSLEAWPAAKKSEKARNERKEIELYDKANFVAPGWYWGGRVASGKA